MKLKFIVILIFFFFVKSFAAPGTENCYCYGVSFNTKLIEYQLPQYDISEFKKVKKGAKKENPVDMYKYAIFILTNNEHGLISIKELDKIIKKNNIYIYNQTDEEKRLLVALNVLLLPSLLNHKESQFLTYYLSFKSNGNPKNYYINFLRRSVANNYEPALELMAQLYLAGNQIEINNKKPFKDDKNYLFTQSNLFEASKLLEKLPNNKNAQFELGKIYLSKEYNQYNQNIDFHKVKKLFENIGELDYFNQKIKYTYDYRYIINYSNLFPKVNANILTNKTIEESQAYDLINQFNEYKYIFTESDAKNMRYSILGSVDKIEHNIYKDYEDYVFKNIKDYNYYSIDEDSWFKTINKEDRIEIVKYLENINDANRYLRRFRNGKYINETNEILVSVYNNSRELYNNFNSKEAYQNYINNFPKSPYLYEFESKIDALAEAETIQNEKITQEKIRIENEKQRKLVVYKPQIEAYNKLAQNYAYSYMRQLSPNTGKNASFYFDSNDFDSIERKVTLKWEAKFISSGITEYIGNLAGLSNPYELYELYGTINVSEGSFNLNSQNSRVSTLKQFNDILDVSKEFAIYAIKNIAYAVSYVNSYASNDSSSNDNEKIKANNELKDKIEKIKKSLELVEIKKSSFSDSCPCYMYKEKAGFLGRPDWYIFKDDNDKWYYHAGLAVFDSDSYNSLDELLYDKLK